MPAKYRLYRVGAGVLYKTDLSFHTIDDCNKFLSKKINKHIAEPSFKTNSYVKNQFVLMLYYGKYEAKIVKLYNNKINYVLSKRKLIKNANRATTN